MCGFFSFRNCRLPVWSVYRKRRLNTDDRQGFSLRFAELMANRWHFTWPRVLLRINIKCFDLNTQTADDPKLNTSRISTVPSCGTYALLVWVPWWIRGEVEQRWPVAGDFWNRHTPQNQQDALSPKQIVVNRDNLELKVNGFGGSRFSIVYNLDGSLDSKSTAN